MEKDSTIKPINVRLNVAESAVYYVLGEVNSPGSYPIIGRETVLDGIMAAGGLSDRASECRVILSRPTPPSSCRIVLPVCYDRIVQLGDTTTNYQIQPGDRIFVGTRTLCDALMFWRSGCPSCPECGERSCRDAAPPINPPFVLEPYPQVAEPELIVLPPASDVPGDATPMLPVPDEARIPLAPSRSRTAAKRWSESSRER
jgi:hypothetical protein